MSEPLPELPVEPDAEQSYSWRVFAFKRMGFDFGTSMMLAGNRHADLHEVENALEGGCSHELAVRIFS